MPHDHSGRWFCPRNRDEFQQDYKAEPLRTFVSNDLTTKECHLGGSDWTAKHLQICRVLLTQRTGHLPVLRDHVAAARTAIRSDKSQRDSLRAVNHFPFVSLGLTSSPTGWFSTSFKSAVLKLAELSTFFVRDNGSPFGIFHTRLAELLQSVAVHDPLDNATRPSQLLKHKTLTESAISAFVSCVLNLFTKPGPPDMDTPYIFHTAPMSWGIIAGNLCCLSADDGALGRCNKIFGQWEYAQPDNVAPVLVQARRFRSTGAFRTEVPLAYLARQACAMLAFCLEFIPHGRSAAIEDFPCNGHLFLLAAFNSDLIIVHWAVTQEYLDYAFPVLTESKTKVKETRTEGDIVPGTLPYMELEYSAPYDLRTDNGRRDAVLALVALTRFYEEARKK